MLNVQTLIVRHVLLKDRLSVIHAKKTSSCWITGSVRTLYVKWVSFLIFQSTSALIQFARSINVQIAVLVESLVAINVNQITSTIGQINAFSILPAVFKAALAVRMMSISAKSVTLAYSTVKNLINV